MSHNPSRRSFLTQTTLGGTAALVAAQIAQARHTFSSQLNAAVKLDSADDEFERLAEQYLLSADIVYLNHASIGTTPRIVHEARQKYLEICESNPWLYMWGHAWEEPVEQTRAKAAALLGCQLTEVAITHNTTEMFNTLAHGLPLAAGDEVLFSTLCHTGASQAFKQFGPDRGVEARQFEFPVSRLPTISASDIVDAYSKQIKSNTRLLVISHVDNTLGVRYPVRAIADMARDQGVEFIAVDAAQTVGMLPVNVSQWNVDVVATSPHKWLQSPKGLGLAFVHQRLHEVLQPMWVTWGQDRWPLSARRYEDYGTRNVAEVLSLGDAIDFNLQIESTAQENRLGKLWEHARGVVAGNSKLRWVSPDSWGLAASLYAVEPIGRSSTELAESLFRDHRIVVRPFEVLGVNTLRISPNIFNSKRQLNQLFELVSS